MKALFVLVLALLVLASNCTLGIIAGLAAAKFGLLKGLKGGLLKGGIKSGHGKKSGHGRKSGHGSKSSSRSKSSYGGKKIIGGGCNKC
jgi:hypothetical protein